MPTYNSKYPIQMQNALEYIDGLKEREEIFEIKPIKKRMALKFRGYTHILYRYFAACYGETEDYVKEVIFKQWVNPETFKSTHINRKTGEVRERWKSTEEVGTAVMVQCVEKFKNWSIREVGILLPEAENKDAINSAIEEIRLNQAYL